MTPSRRIFVIRSIAGASGLTALAWANSARAQALATVADTDPQAIALGYKTAGSSTDTKKYPNYAANQSCASCTLFQGKGTDSTGNCPVFGNKLVSRNGWCSAWTKKA